MLCLQELVEIVGRSTGIALMAPPTDSDTAQKTLDTLLSAVNKKQKVSCTETPCPCTSSALQALYSNLSKYICKCAYIAMQNCCLHTPDLVQSAVLLWLAMTSYTVLSLCPFKASRDYLMLIAC